MDLVNPVVQRVCREAAENPEREADFRERFERAVLSRDQPGRIQLLFNTVQLASYLGMEVPAAKREFVLSHLAGLADTD